MKRISLIVILLLTTIYLSGCFYSVDNVESGIEYGYNDLTNKAFAGPYYWDGETVTQSFTILNEYNGDKVTMLGGYSGRGYPRPFYIYMPEEYESVTSTIRRDLNSGTLDFVNIVFNVTIGEGINKLKNIIVDEYYQALNDDVNVYYKIVYFFTVDEDNEFLYSEEGKIYYVENDILVEEFEYYEE